MCLTQSLVTIAPMATKYRQECKRDRVILRAKILVFAEASRRFCCRRCSPLFDYVIRQQSYKINFCSQTTPATFASMFIACSLQWKYLMLLLLLITNNLCDCYDRIFRVMHITIKHCSSSEAFCVIQTHCQWVAQYSDFLHRTRSKPCVLRHWLQHDLHNFGLSETIVEV